jgi:hypothetical protein
MSEQSVRERVAASSAVGRAFRFCYGLGVAGVVFAGLGLHGVLYVTWIEILHTAGAPQPLPPMTAAVFDGVFGLPVLGLSAGITAYTVDAVAETDISVRRTAVTAAGIGFALLAVQLALIRVGVLG